MDKCASFNDGEDGRIEELQIEPNGILDNGPYSTA